MNIEKDEKIEDMIITQLVKNKKGGLVNVRALKKSF